MAFNINDLKNKYLGLLSGAKNTLSSAVGNVGQQVNNMVASAPYTLNNVNLAVQKATLPPTTWDQSINRVNPMGNTINQNLPIKQPVLSGMSYNPDPYMNVQVLAGQNRDNVNIRPFNNEPAPQSDPRLEAMKQNILNSPNLRDVAKNYQSNIPLTFENLPPTVMGNAANKGGEHPYIAISDRVLKPIDPRLSPQRQVEQKAYNQEQLNQIIEHELLHQTPRLVPTEMFHPQNKAVIDEYTQRWGADYMKHPKALVEEMFAEQDLPPAYYWHVFKKVNPKAKEKDFISALKSYFINKINTPEQTPEPTFNNGQGIPGRQIQPYGQPIK